MRLVRSETPGIRRLIVESVVPSSDLCASILFEIVGASEEEPSLRRVAAASLNTMIDRPAIVGAAIDRMEREFDKGAPDYDTVAAYARCLKRLRSRTGDHGSIRRLQAMMCFPMNEAAIQAVLEALC